MPPDDGADEQVDWETAERVWGAAFPSDYVASMACFGAGGIDGALSVVSPHPEDPGGIADETATMRSLWKD